MHKASRKFTQPLPWLLQSPKYGITLLTARVGMTEWRTTGALTTFSVGVPVVVAGQSKTHPDRFCISIFWLGLGSIARAYTMPPVPW